PFSKSSSYIVKNTQTHETWYSLQAYEANIETCTQVQAESFDSLLKFQLEDAVEKEEFQEATKLKRAIEEATFKDSVAEIMSQLKNTVMKRKYIRDKEEKIKEEELKC
ncbi:hypothetical protein RYX36_035318, partial [Vicia faba]